MNMESTSKPEASNGPYAWLVTWTTIKHDSIKGPVVVERGTYAMRQHPAAIMLSQPGREQIIEWSMPLTKEQYEALEKVHLCYADDRPDWLHNTPPDQTAP